MIEAEKAQHGVAVSRACELLGVSGSGYQKWLTRPPSDRALSDAWLAAKIKEIHQENRGAYGAPRVHAELRMQHGVHVGRKRVERLNAVAETFFATLKKEMVYRRSWPTRQELIGEILEFIEAFYNRQRRHSTLGMLSPVEFEGGPRRSTVQDLR
jgi:transposase InsO family protein